jgi:hypothetical protein
MTLPGLEARFLVRHYTIYAIPASNPSLFHCRSFLLTYELRTLSNIPYLVTFVSITCLISVGCSTCFRGKIQQTQKDRPVRCMAFLSRIIKCCL